MKIQFVPSKPKMALRKRKSIIKLEKALTRLEAMNIIDLRYGKHINYGWEQNPLTIVELSNQIEKCKKLVNEYNGALEIADKKALELKNAENLLGEFFTRVLAGGKSIFGVDSFEVTELGGTRRSERKRKVKSI